jgi:hypothetical protein
VALKDTFHHLIRWVDIALELLLTNARDETLLMRLTQGAMPGPPKLAAGSKA